MTYRVYIGGIILLFSISILIYRIMVFNREIKKLQKNSNIYSIWDLYNGEIVESEELILIGEESVD